LQVLQLSAHECNTRASFSERTRDSARDTRATASNKRHASVQNPLSKYSFAHIF
jgi:hypothetical protein